VISTPRHTNLRAPGFLQRSAMRGRASDPSTSRGRSPRPRGPSCRPFGISWVTPPSSPARRTSRIMCYSIGGELRGRTQNPERGAVVAAGDKPRPPTELVPSHAPSRIVADPALCLHRYADSRLGVTISSTVTLRLGGLVHCRFRPSRSPRSASSRSSSRAPLG
jgi:hypothetical protein